MKHNPTLNASFKAGSVWTVGRRFAVETANANEVDIVATQGADCIGVTTGNPRRVGDPMRIDMAGIVLVESGGAIALKDEIISDNVGRAIHDPGTGSTTVFVQGRAMSTAAGAGEVVAIEVRKYKLVH